MIKIFITAVALLANLQAGELMIEGKPEIATNRYSMKFVNDYERDGYDCDYSYENYFNHVNSHKEYKHNTWCLPIKEEVLTLQLRNNFFLKLFASRERHLNELAYDEKNK